MRKDFSKSYCCLYLSVQEHKRCCVPVCLTICFCNYQCFAVACACVPSSFEDHKYGRCSRQTRRLFGTLVNNASEVVTFSSAALFLFFCHPSFCSFSPQKAHGRQKKKKNLLRKKKKITAKPDITSTFRKNPNPLLAGIILLFFFQFFSWQVSVFPPK